MVLLGMVTLVLTALTWAVHPRAPAYGDGVAGEGAITLAILDTYQGEILWVDARTEAEYHEGHAPGAILVNEDDYDAGLERLLFAWDPAQMLIVYCGESECASSQAVALRLKRDLGIENVLYLEDGWEGLQTWP